jgi:hypothetical protein
LPIFADGLRILFNRVKKYNIVHLRRPLLEKAFSRRIRGILWSAWTPYDSLYRNYELTYTNANNATIIEPVSLTDSIHEHDGYVDIDNIRLFDWNPSKELS